MEMTMCHSVSKNIKRLFSFLLCAASLLFTCNSNALSLKQAEQLAIQSDPSIKAFKATSLSFVDESVADDTLPDPKLRFGSVHVPVATFDLDQE